MRIITLSKEQQLVFTADRLMFVIQFSPGSFSTMLQLSYLLQLSKQFHEDEDLSLQSL